MRLFKGLILAVLFFILLPKASAQDNALGLSLPSGGWTELSAQYSFNLEFDEVWTEGYNFNTVGISGGLAFPVMSNIPLYARANLGLFYTSDRLADGEPSDWYSYYTYLKPSVDVGYLLTIYKSVKLFVYPSLYTKLNLYGRDVYKMGDGQYRARNRMIDVDDDDRMLRVQFGWQVGAELEVERVMFGLFMNRDLTHLYADDDPTRVASLIGIKLGYKF
jgi:hypothetical protein